MYIHKSYIFLDNENENRYDNQKSLFSSVLQNHEKRDLRSCLDH